MLQVMPSMLIHLLKWHPCLCVVLLQLFLLLLLRLLLYGSAAGPRNGNFRQGARRGPHQEPARKNRPVARQGARRNGRRTCSIALEGQMPPSTCRECVRPPPELKICGAAASLRRRRTLYEASTRQVPCRRSCKVPPPHFRFLPSCVWTLRHAASVGCMPFPRNSHLPLHRMPPDTFGVDFDVGHGPAHRPHDPSVLALHEPASSPRRPNTRSSARTLAEEAHGQLQPTCHTATSMMQHRLHAQPDLAKRLWAGGA